MGTHSLSSGVARRGLCSDGSRAKVVYYLGERPDVEQTARRLFRRELEMWEYAALVGAPDDAEVEVGTLDGGLYLDMYQPVTSGYRAVQLVRLAGADPIVIIEALHVHETLRGKGLGLRIFNRQLATASALGVTRIETSAGRGEDENGYYTWPRFGFDGPLAAEIEQNLPLGLEHVENVLDLMECEKGRQWWREYGIPIHLAFDVTGQSRSRHVFRQYLAERLPFNPNYS